MTGNTTYAAPDVDLTFEAIDEHVSDAGVDALLAQSALVTSVTNAQKVVKAYTTVRPILAALSALSLVPMNWRLALRVFIEALDVFTAASGAAAQDDFKAGKDL
jgi:hypothetical protein